MFDELKKAKAKADDAANAVVAAHDAYMAAHKEREKLQAEARELLGVGGAVVAKDPRTLWRGLGVDGKAIICAAALCLLLFLLLVTPMLTASLMLLVVFVGSMYALGKVAGKLFAGEKIGNLK